MSVAPIRRAVAATLLTAVAMFLLFVVLPPSRDATHGVVSVYFWSSADGPLPPVKFRAVVEAQAVIELRRMVDGSSRSVKAYGFERCAVFDRKNWECERPGKVYRMQKGRLAIVEQSRQAVSPEVRQVSRFTWWAHRMVSAMIGD